MSRLIVISNRIVTPKANSAAGSQGGLAVALTAALRERKGIWFGWSGNKTDVFSGHLDVQRHNGITTATIDLEPQDVDEYYNGYANRTLWPLFHYRIDLTEYERHFGSGYERVNERFAQAALPLIESDDLVWVHDYHFLPLGDKLRQLGIRNRIGLFLHIPWPPSRLLVTLPYHERLVRSMLSYDLIGFQTEEWLESFLHYLDKELDIKAGPDRTFLYEGRTIKAKAFPIGIDFEEFTQAANSKTAIDACERLKSSARNRKIAIGVDRLDYSKGLAERFDAYDRFLTDNPGMEKELILLQIAPPSRELVESYRHIRENLETKTGHINGTHADVGWVPIRYVNRGYPRHELAGFYRAADIALVTPLRDGMNLVAKEYIAAQDPEDPGVLILSRFAGAALQLTEALLVNPHNTEGVSEAIGQALAMSREERIRRWKIMVDSVRRDDVVTWRENYIRDLSEPK